MPRSVRLVSNLWMPELWASPKPFGLGEQHSNNFREVFRALWENRDQLPYAYSSGAGRNRCNDSGMVHEDIDANTAASRDAS